MAPRKNREESERSPVTTAVLSFLAILGIVFVLWFIVRVKTVAIIIVISIVLASGLAPAVERLQNVRLPRGKRFPRGIAIALIYLLGFVIALSATALIVVPVVQEAIQFSRNSPEYLANVQQWLAGLHQKYPQLPDYASLVSRAQSQASEAAQYLLSSAGAVFGFLGGIISVISVIVITFYILSTYETIINSILTVIPPAHREKTRTVLSHMGSTMGGCLRGQVLLAGIIGVTTSVAMLVMGVPYPFVIGIVGAIGELVPMVGPAAAAIPAVLVTALGPPYKLVLVIIFFMILAQVENNFLAPRIMQKQVGIPPLVTLVALLVGGALLGIVGALLAIPVAAALRVLIVEAVVPAITHHQNRGSEPTKAD